MGAHRQINAKLEAPEIVPVPDLATLRGVASADASEDHSLEAVHWDTADLRLARARITLRRRTGGASQGWQLKVPVSADEWIDLRAPLGTDDAVVPAELLAAIAARVREATIEPVVVLRTARKVHALRDAHGRVLLTVADDAVTAVAPGPGGARVDAWREWEVELGHGDQDLLARALGRLRAGGGTAPAWTSKLTRALGEQLVAAASEDPDGDPLDPRFAGAVLRDHLRSKRDLLLARDPRVRRNQPGAAHQMRAATGALRAALATFRPLLVREPSELVRVELGWLAGLLGADRDAQLAREQLAELVAQEASDLVLGPVVQRLSTDLAADCSDAHRRVLEALDSGRYFQLLDALDELVMAPQLTKAAAKPADRVLPALVRRDWVRLVAAYDAASSALPGARRDALLGEAAKACTRVRCAADVAAPVVGGPAVKLARAAKELQTLLAHREDLVMLGAVLRGVAVDAAQAGENSFTYGRLHALAQARAASVDERLPAAWDKVSAPRRHRWMR
ncbi:CHAD domain-containing protein [Pengzhenrongella phosphoraccumulans]|uniref:CYTH and CHAD domain-containing protein n=1 Tax=Pengzhenrongella phosphoraccumulans TaxID=3114394 RepID=UPI003890102C